MALFDLRDPLVKCSLGLRFVTRNFLVLPRPDSRHEFFMGLLASRVLQPADDKLAARTPRHTKGKAVSRPIDQVRLTRLDPGLIIDTDLLGILWGYPNACLTIFRNAMRNAQKPHLEGIGLRIVFAADDEAFSADDTL